MKPTVCPYLGLQDDPETHLAFPSPRNCCRRAHPVESINLDHQSTTCLCMNYLHCTVLAASLNLPLPLELRLNVPSRKRNLVGVGISVVLIVVLLIFGWWQSGGILARSAAPAPTSYKQDVYLSLTPFPLVTSKVAIPNLMSEPKYTPTMLPTPVSTDISFPSETLFFTETPILPTSNTDTPYPTSTTTICAPPSGWVVYIVQPNDSLFRVGLEFGVTVIDLQIANCMGDSVIIYAGQKLYVPNVATRTPISTPTRTPTEIVFQPTLIEPFTETPVPSPTDTLLPNATPPLPTSTPSITLPPVPTETLTPSPPETTTR